MVAVWSKLKEATPAFDILCFLFYHPPGENYIDRCASDDGSQHGTSESEFGLSYHHRILRIWCFNLELNHSFNFTYCKCALQTHLSRSLCGNRRKLIRLIFLPPHFFTSSPLSFPCSSLSSARPFVPCSVRG